MTRRAGSQRLAALAAACVFCGAAGREQAPKPVTHGGEIPGLKETEVFPDPDPSSRAKTVYDWDKRQLGEREYVMQFPDDWQKHPYNRSLLVLLHGFQDSSYSMPRKFANLLSMPGGPILVAPMGMSDWGMPTSWNTRGSDKSSGPDGPLCSNDTIALGCGTRRCGWECYPCVLWFQCAPQCVYSTCADDYQFISDLLDEVEGIYDIDPQKVFLAGFSQGGMMTWDIAGHSTLAKRFTAVAPLHGSPQAGFAALPATPTTGPWVMGLWGGKNADLMDPRMPPFSNFPGRSDKARTFFNEYEGSWYYNTAENATKTYAKRLKCPTVGGVSLKKLTGPKAFKDAEINCRDEGCNGAVIRCTWPTSAHTVADFASTLVWRYFLLAKQARYG